MSSVCLERWPQTREDYEIEEPDDDKVDEDRLSELPEPLIVDILSFLPTRDAVRTTLLSKRWKDLWTTVSCLDFSDDGNDAGKYQDFVNGALNFWKGPKILKFKIDFLFDLSLCRDIDSWARFVMENKVEELYIRLTSDAELRALTDNVYCALQYLYLCSSIRRLSISGCNVKIDGEVHLHWDQLKCLTIEDACIKGNVINQVLSGTPQLEVLILRLVESFDNLMIQSSSLKIVTVENCLHNNNNPLTVTVLTIRAPNVEILEISGVPYKKCLLSDVSSLTDATLGFSIHKRINDSKQSLFRKMLRQLFLTIHRVEKLTLSEWCIKVLGATEKECLISPFFNVKFLNLNASSIKLEKTVNLLQIFPNLKMLVIEHTDRRFKVVEYQISREYIFSLERNFRKPIEFDAEPQSSLLQLRTVQITWFLFETETLIFPFIEFLLKHASMLEKMVIRARSIVPLAPESLLLAAQKLLSMPRSSPTAKVILCEK